MYFIILHNNIPWGCIVNIDEGRPEGNGTRKMAMNRLGNGLFAGGHQEEALSVREALLSEGRRLGEREDFILIAQNNLAGTYQVLGRHEEALPLRRDVYSGFVKLNGEEHEKTLQAASNYATSLCALLRFKEVKSLMRTTIPVARRVLGDDDRITFMMRWNYVDALYKDPGATLDDLREVVRLLEDLAPTARRVLGSAHPVAAGIERDLRESQAVLRAQEDSS